MFKGDNLIVGLVAKPAGTEALSLIFFMEWFLLALHLMCISARIGAYQSIQMTHKAWGWAPAKWKLKQLTNTTRNWLYSVTSSHCCTYMLKGMFFSQYAQFRLKRWHHKCHPRQLVSAIALIFPFFFELLKYNGTPLSEWAFDQFKWWVLGVPYLRPRNYSSSVLRMKPGVEMTKKAKLGETDSRCS